MQSYNPIEQHLHLAEELPLPMAYDASCPFSEQREATRALLLRLLAMPERKTTPTAQIEWERDDDPRFTEIRFLFESEPHFFVPAHLLPKSRTSDPLPVVICLQGHTPGMCISLRRDLAGNPIEVTGDRDFAIQAVEQGFAAVAMEQRGFGELGPKVIENCNCTYLSSQALLIGRTLLGERCFDISQLLYALHSFDMLNFDRVGVMGNSGGGTATYFAAAAIPEISAAMPSCGFRRYTDAQMARLHCTCSYVPRLMQYMDMPDLAVLIAPRPLVIVAGTEDYLASLSEVQRGFETVKTIYRAAGAPDACRLVVGEGGHRFYAAQGWAAFSAFLQAH